VPRKHLVVSVVAGLALLTGCGAAPGPPTTIEPAAAVRQQQPTQPASINAADVTGLGTVLTDQGGKTLYLFTKDTKDPSASTCVDQCAEMWPPLLTAGDPLVTGVNRGLVATVTRPDGGTQVTVGGWPVYMYTGDTSPGQANGQGLQGVWFAVTPEGTKAGAPAAKPVAVVAKEIPGFGSALTDQDGRTLYLFTKDSKNPPKSTCDGDCAATWPPLMVTPNTEPQVTGVDPALVGIVARSDGTQQVTVGGWPVYLYVKDTKPGQTNGHGVGGVWFVIEEKGCKSSAPVPSESSDSSDPSGEADDSTGY
jgi:predicted lipoprotein with Yx(FWY)xxD motif